MQKERLKKAVTGGMVNVLDKTLKTKANTASCTLWYEPKAPEKLSRYRREK